jgi:hypothetical protein
MATRTTADDSGPDLDTLLERAAQAYFAKGHRIAKDWRPGPMPRPDKLRGGALGQDLDRLDRAACGELFLTAEEVAALRQRVLSDLFQPLGADEVFLPLGFWDSELGQVIREAEARAGQLPAATVLASPPVPADSPAGPPMLGGVRDVGASAERPAIGASVVSAGTGVDTPTPQGPTMAARPGSAAAPPAPPTAPRRQPASPAAPWYADERNARGLLYLGGFLVVAALFIFVVYNWGSFPGTLKSGLILGATLGLYGLGYALHRTRLATAGVTFIAMASVVAPLDVFALYQCVLKDLGVPGQVVWLGGSVACLLLYALTGWWLRTALLTYAAAGALASGAVALLYVSAAPPQLWDSTLAALGLVLAWLGTVRAEPRGPRFVVQPLRHTGLAVAAGAALGALAWTISGEQTHRLALNDVAVALVLAALAYSIPGHLRGWRPGRIVGYALVVPAYVAFMTQFSLDTLGQGLSLMALGIAYLAVSGLPRIRAYGARDQWTLRWIGYGLAAATTTLAADNRQYLLIALAVDLAILAALAFAYRSVGWWRAAVWLGVATWYLALDLWIPSQRNNSHEPLMALAMGLLPLLCALAWVYLVGRRPSVADPLGTAALVVMPAAALLTPHHGAPAAVLLGTAAALWLGAAWYRGSSRPAYLAGLWLEVALVIAFGHLAPTDSWDGPVAVGLLVALGLGQLVVAHYSERLPAAPWSWPLHAWGALNLVAAWGLALSWVARTAWYTPVIPHDGLSEAGLVWLGAGGLLGAVCLAAAWLKADRPGWSAWARGLLTYAGLAVLAVAFTYAVWDRRVGDYVAAAVAGGCLLGIVLSQILPRGRLARTYGDALRCFSLVVIWLPLAAVVADWEPAPAAVAYLVATLAYALDAYRHRALWIGLLAVGFGAVAYAATLQARGVTEVQAYVLPYGVGILGLLHYYRARLAQEVYALLTVVGLAILYLPTLAQSLSAAAPAPYIALMLAEGLVGLAWGLRQRSRLYVLASTVALLAEVGFQLFHEIAALPSWLLIGAAGTILLTAGVLALARQAEMVALGRALGREWNAWQL